MKPSVLYVNSNPLIASQYLRKPLTNTNLTTSTGKIWKATKQLSEVLVLIFRTFTLGYETVYIGSGGQPLSSLLFYKSSAVFNLLIASRIWGRVSAATTAESDLCRWKKAKLSLKKWELSKTSVIREILPSDTMGARQHAIFEKQSDKRSVYVSTLVRFDFIMQNDRMMISVT